MKRRYSKESEKNFLLILGVLFLLLTFFVIKDIFAVIIFSLILSYFLFPLYTFFLRKFGDPRISSLMSLLSATVVLFVPLALMMYFVILSLIRIIVEYKVYIENPEVLNAMIGNFIEKFTDSETLTSLNFSEIFNTFVVWVVDISQGFFTSIPVFFLNFFIILFISYYILIYNKTILNMINDYIPLTMRKQNEILRNITKNLQVLFKGYFVTGIIQTAVALLGYIVFGAPNLVLLTFLTLIASLIPYLGTPLIWIPISFYMVISGDTINGVGLLLYGTFIISIVDNFVRPVLMSDKETISPPLVFIGFIGGLFAFGIAGIILGPIIISISIILLKYLKEYYEIRE